MASTWVSSTELTEIIGQANTKVLQKHRGGVSFYVPKTPTGFLLPLLGEPATLALCVVYGGEYIVVPMGNKRDPIRPRIVAMLNQKQPHRTIALQLGVTERYVELVAAQTRHHVQQLNLL